MATTVHFPIDAGTYFSSIVTIENDDGTPFDLTGLTLDCKMKRSYYTSGFVQLHSEIYGDATNGEVRIWANSSDTEDVKPARYVYDVRATDSVNPERDIRLVEGVITLTPRVT